MRINTEVEDRLNKVKEARDLAHHLGLITRQFDLMIEVLEWVLEGAETQCKGRI